MKVAQAEGRIQQEEETRNHQQRRAVVNNHLAIKLFLPRPQVMGQGERKKAAQQIPGAAAMQQGQVRGRQASAQVSRGHQQQEAHQVLPQQKASVES